MECYSAVKRMKQCHLQNLDGARDYLKSETERQIPLRLMTQLKGLCVCLVAQSRLTLGDPMDCSPPGSSVHGIFQARILEQVAISYTRRDSREFGVRKMWNSWNKEEDSIDEIKHNGKEYKKECMHMDHWITFLYTWNELSFVKQLYSNKY